MGVISLNYKFEPSISWNGWDNFLVPCLATREVVAPPANDPIMSGRSKQLFRHPEHQNLSTGDDFVQSSGIIFLVPFLATRDLLVLIANDPIMSGRLIRSCRYLEYQNLSISLDFIDISTWFCNSLRRSSSTKRIYNV